MEHGHVTSYSEREGLPAWLGENSRYSRFPSISRNLHCPLVHLHLYFQALKDGSLRASLERAEHSREARVNCRSNCVVAMRQRQTDLIAIGKTKSPKKAEQEPLIDGFNQPRSAFEGSINFVGFDISAPEAHLRTC